MRTFKLITKGVLLYVTILVTLLYMMGIDSIYDNGYFFHGLILVLILIGVCYKTISKEELEILTLNQEDAIKAVKMLGESVKDLF